jgi:signal transduction histidine kinase
VGRLASETATHKLGQILGLLVIPMLVLWLSYYVQAKGEIDKLSSEIAGAELAKLEASDLESTPETRAWSKMIGLSSAPEMGSDKNSIGAGRQKAESVIQSRLMAIHQISGLALDGSTESHALAEVALVTLPAFRAETFRLFDAIRFEAKSNRQRSIDFGALNAALGNTQSTLNRITDALPAAHALRTPLYSIQSDLKSAVSSLVKTTYAQSHIENFIQLDIVDQYFTDGRYATLQSGLLNRLLENLRHRRSMLWRNLLLISLAGLISAIAGIGLSVLMMRSTFLQLDAVGVAHLEAQNARRDAEQVALRFTTINNDISNLNRDLASRVNELKLAQDELLRKGRIEQLGQLTATIAHEIRNPLGAIRTSIFMLERKTSKAGLDTGELIERINNSVNRCDSIISQLHDFARMKEPNIRLAKLDDWLSKAVRDEVSRLPSDIFVECSLGLDETQVSFDPVQLQKAVGNLLSNACEALVQTEANTTQVGKQKSIWVSSLRHLDHVCIIIADNGPGIASEYLNKIREPMYTTKSFGSGLGIPVVEKIVRQQGGQLDITSDLGVGTKVTIRLPLSQIKGLSDVA